VATALHSLNPQFCVFEPSEVLRALDHVVLLIVQVGRIWESLQSLQRSLPPISALRESGTAQSIR
jgi:hypothetical protein